MFGKSADSTLMQREPRFSDIMCSLQSVGRMPRAIVKETRDAIELARRFSDEVIRPYGLELDRKMQEDPTYLPWDFLEEANRWGLYTNWIPKFLGGKGWSLDTVAPFMEELAAVDSVMGFLIGVQYFGLSILLATWNMRLINKILRDVVEGERNDKPCLLCGAVTEPEAGTDAEEVELLARAKVQCHAVKMNGGYVVNGSKVFISNGHVATWTLLIAYEDLERPDESMVVMAVRKGTKGFSLGRMEHKMGQKACPTSQLIFEDCFIPDENVCLSSKQVKYLKRGAKDTGMQLIDFVVSLTRPGVGAAAAGVARGAYQEALRFAQETQVDGKLLINHEWAQCLLAEMYKNVALARLTYMECNYVNGLNSMVKLLHLKPVYYGIKLLPTSLFDRIAPPLYNRELTTRMVRKLFMDNQEDEEACRTSGWASLSKFAATDLAVENCQKAMELMGQAGLRQDHWAEKYLRDIKVMQIFEGTNQLNRLNLFKCLIGRSIPAAKVFED